MSDINEETIYSLNREYFVLSEMIDMLYDNLETFLDGRNKELRGEMKQNHSRLMQGLKTMKYALNKNADIISQLDIRNWDNIHIEANYLMRIILLITDRASWDMEKQKQIEDFIKSFESKNLIREQLINRFYLK